MRDAFGDPQQITVANVHVVDSMFTADGAVANLAETYLAGAKRNAGEIWSRPRIDQIDEFDAE